jgi:putative transferase (TIGR04331 family)
MIKKAESEFPIEEVMILEDTFQKNIPNDMAQFNEFLSLDEWNETIYGELIKNWTHIPYRIVKQAITTKQPEAKISTIRRLKRKLFSKASEMTQFCLRKNEAYFVSTYLPFWKDILLQLKLNQFPRVWSNIPIPAIEADLGKRNWKLGNGISEGFPAIIRAMIPKQIPKIYLEGFNELNNTWRNLNWPSNPSLIFTSNSFFLDEVFKAWTANKTAQGVPLIIGQHGGSYGLSPIAPLEKHECEISNAWLSWGWSDKNIPKIKPICNLKLVDSKQSWDPNGAALLVEMLVPRYSYRLLNFHIASQWLNYFGDQCRFVKALPEEIRHKLIVRLPFQDYGWKQKKRWNDSFPDIILDLGKRPITKLIRKSRIYISTYNSTTFLESMAQNIPTIIFWDEHYYELRESAIPYFERLKEIGIFHATPESAALHMTKVWEDIGKWWNSRLVQDVRKEFCYQYSRMPEKPLNKMKDILQNISKNSNN